MSQGKDGFSLSSSEEQSAFDTSILALRAIHNEEVAFLKREIERLTQELQKMTEKKDKYKESCSRYQKIFKAIGNSNGAMQHPQFAVPLMQSARASPRGPHSPESGRKVIGSRTTVQLPQKPSLPASTPDNRTARNESATASKPVPKKHLFGNDGGNNDDDDDDVELPLKNRTGHTPGGAQPNVGTPKQGTANKPTPSFPRFSSSKKTGNESDFWEIQRPGMYDSPVKKKPRKTPQQGCAGVGVVPFAIDAGEVKVLLYEPLDESNDKRGFLVDFGGPVERGGDLFESALNTLMRETNNALFDPNDELKRSPSVKNDSGSGYTVLFLKVKYQDPKNFEASVASERNRKYVWVSQKAILENDMNVLKVPLHERMTKAKDFYTVLEKLV